MCCSSLRSAAGKVVINYTKTGAPVLDAKPPVLVRMQSDHMFSFWTKLTKGYTNFIGELVVQVFHQVYILT